MTNQVDLIILEAFELAGFKPAFKYPETFLVNMVDNLGVFYRDYTEQFPRLLVLLGAICESAS